MNENEIIRGCLNNDRASQKALYDTFYSKMLGVCMRYSRTNDEAEDLVHEGFLKVFNKIDKLNNSDSLEGWMKRIMVNTAIDLIRKNKNNSLLMSNNYADENFSDVADEIEDTDFELHFEKKDIMKAVQELSPAYRTVFNLYIMEDYSHKQISELLNISEGTSKSNLSKAKVNVRESLMNLKKKTHVK